MAHIVELRILPPFAIGRLGGSPKPMDDYELRIDDPIGYRQIVAADSLLVDPRTAELSVKKAPFEVSFRDASGDIRPVSPFLEVWARLAGSDQLVPLDEHLLHKAGLKTADLKWSVQVGNIKAFRRTGDPGDKVIAELKPFGDHEVKSLLGVAPNFLKNKSIPLGSVQYIKPSKEFPEIRLRFTPAAGKVYGPPLKGGGLDGNLADVVYDPAIPHKWRGYEDPVDATKDPLGVRKATNPGNVYAGTDNANQTRTSWGYLDDECDGIVRVELHAHQEDLTAYARIAAGPPTFAPDSLPVRTVYDELEQALHGPTFNQPVTEQDLDDVQEIVRRAMETVRLMNTGQMNRFSAQRGVGMARMDFLDVNRAGEPIVDPAVADSLAIRSRHERVLLALESGSLAWFARVLREHDQVGDLSPEGRQKMPALMRGADARHLALTRRQVNKVRAAAEFLKDLGRKEGGK